MTNVRGLRQRMEQAEAEVETLTAAIERVQALHRPSLAHDPHYPIYCIGCWEAGGRRWAPSFDDCPTLKALRGPA